MTSIALAAGPIPRKPGLSVPPVPLRRGLAATRLTDMGVLVPTALVVVTVLVRALFVTTAYDINGDEIDYSSLTLSLRHGSFPPLFNGNRFLLHPPGFFAVGAVWGDLLGVQGDYIHQLYALRVLNVVFAAVSALLIYRLGVQLVGRSVGAGAALIFALDPYILRQNGRVMLETSTLTFVLGGYVVLTTLLEGRSRRPRASAVGGGLLLGIGILDKDVAAILIVVPLALLLWRNMGLDRRLVGTALGASLVPYVVYLVGLAAEGYFPSFLSQETLGLRRQLGLVQETGFNTAGNPSLFSTALNQLSKFGVTYLISGLGIIAAIYLLVRFEEPALRLWAMVTLAGAASLAYSVLFGTIEEQMLYFMYVPAIIALVAGLVLFARGRAPSDPVRNHRIRRAVAWAVVIFCAYDMFVWAQVRTTPDNGMPKVVAWFQDHDPNPGVIGNNTEVTTDLLVRSGFQAVNLFDPQTAAGDHVRFLTILSATLVGNYGSLSKEQAAFFEHYGHLVYSFHENTYGTVSVWETANPAIW